MLKVEYQFNTEKIQSIGEYQIDEFYRVIRNAHAKQNLPEVKEKEKEDTLTFRDNGKNTDFANMANIFFALAEEEWFATYIQKLMYYDTENERENTDVLEVLKKRDQIHHAFYT